MTKGHFISPLMGDISQQVERLKFQESLPSLEAIMFLEGTKYQCGSDYGEEYLRTSIGELQSIHNMKIVDEIANQQNDYGEFSWE